MEIQKHSRHVLICLVLLMTVLTLLITGCTETVLEEQAQVTATGNVQNEKQVTATAVTTRTTVMDLQTITPAASKPALSTGAITIDPISDKNTGDKFTLTGTTSLPPGTNILWQIIPDTGTPPTGLEPESQMSVGGNYQVTKGDDDKNRLSIAVDLGRLVPGKYIAIVGKMKGDGTTGMVFEIGEDYGYTYFSLK